MTRPSQRPLRVTFILPVALLGGAETVTYLVARELMSRGCQVKIVVLKADGPLGNACRDSGVAFESLGVMAGSNPAVLWSLAVALLRNRPDAVVCVNFNATFWGRLAAFICRVPVITTAEHSSLTLAKGESRYSRRLNRLLRGVTDATFAVSARQVGWLVSQGYKESRIVVAPNGIELDRFSSIEPLRANSLSLTVGIIASLVPAKNHEMFLRAAAIVHIAMPEVRFLVAGDGPLAEHLSELARGMGLENCVQFLGRVTDVPSLLGGLDVVCLSSDTEALPLSVMEAMAAGRPVIATDVGAVRDLVSPGETGYLVPAGDDPALAAAIHQLLSHPQDVADFGARARAVAMSRFGIEKTADVYESTLGRAVDRKVQHA